MNDGVHLLLWALLRTGVVLTVSAVALSAFLRLYPVASPTVRRTACFVVLLQGCLLMQGPFAVSLPSFVSRGTASVLNRLLKSGDSGATPTASGEDSRGFGLAGCHLRGLWPASVFGSTRIDERALESRPVPRGEGSSTLVAAGGRGSVATGKSTGGPPAACAGPNGRLSSAATDFPATVSLDDPDVVVPRSDSSSPTPFPWAISLVGLWAAGIIVLAGRAAWTYFRFIRRLPPLENVEPEWAHEWESLQRDAGIRRLVPLAVAEQTGPVLFRLPGGYRLIVPALAWRALEPSQRLLILRHELAHIERRDVWKSLAIRVLALPHWFNPLVWRIVLRFDECAEWACDEAARRAAPEHVPDYARALLQLAHRAEPVFFATRAARPCGLSQRIRRLLLPVTEKDSKMKTAVMVTLLLGISLVNLTRLHTRADDGPPATAKQIEVRTIQLTTPTVFHVTTVPQTTFVVGQPTASQTSRVEYVGLLTQPEGRPYSYAESHQAKVDLGQVLKNLHEYQRERERLQAEQQAWQATRAKEREEMVRTAKNRIAAEKDPLIKDLLEKGIAEKSAEMSREINPKAAENEQQVNRRLYEKIMAEIKRYAQERQMLTVRRADFGNRTTGVVGITGTGLRVGPERLALNTTGAVSISAAERLNQAVVMLNLASAQPNSWDQEMIYFAGRDGAQEVDITDEIVKRLNAADEKPAGK